MAQETLAQWADRMHASHYTVQRRHTPLNRGSLTQAQRSRELEEAARKEHERRMAQRAPAAPVAAEPPSLGGGLLSRLGFGARPQPEPVIAPARPQTGPRLHRGPR